MKIVIQIYTLCPKTDQTFYRGSLYRKKQGEWRKGGKRSKLSPNPSNPHPPPSLSLCAEKPLPRSLPMAVPAALVKYRFHLLFALVLSFALLGLVLLAPRFLTLLSYFWPLFLSTALFLVAVVVFGKTSPPPADKAGEGLLDYVTGDPDPAVNESIHSLKTDEQGPRQPTQSLRTDGQDPHEPMHGLRTEEQDPHQPIHGLRTEEQDPHRPIHGLNTDEQDPHKPSTSVDSN